MKYTVAFILFACFCFNSSAQTALEKGDDFFELFQYKEASREYEAALKNERTFKNEAHILSNLAYSYLYTFQYAKAEQSFEQLVKVGDKKPEPRVYLDYGNVLKILGKYEKAKEQFVYYGTLTQKNEYAKFLDRSLNWAIKNKDIVKPTTFVGVTNLDVSGQSLGYSLLGDGIVYAQAKDTNYSEFTALFDLRYAKKIDSVTFTSESEYVNGITFPFNEGSPCISADGQTMYFTATAAKIKKGKAATGGGEVSDDGVSNLRVYSATLTNGEFADVVELSFNHKDYSNLNPFISADGNTLFFVSDMPGGYGGLDIYRCTKLPDGNWSSPINVGDKINTSEHESYPFMVGNELYFSSKGHVGFGGYDLFKCTIGSNFTPGVSQNLGKPFNSSKDDVALVFYNDKVTGYFSSNRDNDEGFDKVYYFNDNYTPSVTKPTFVAVISDSSTLKNTTPMAAIKAAAVKQGLIKSDNKATTPVANKLTKPAAQAVYFDFNSTVVTPASFDELNAFVSYWKQNKTTFINLRAHADCRGTASYNYKLSTNRAMTLYRELVKHGVNKNKILITTIGENEALKECATCEQCTEEQHAKNRRVEVLIK